MYRFWLSSSSFSCRDLRAATAFFPCLFRDGPNPSELRRERANAALQALIKVSSSGIVSAASLSANAIEATMSQRTCAWDKYSPALEAKSLKELSNRLHEAEKDLCNVANRKRKRYVFRSVGRWNRTLNSIGLSFVILVYVCSSVHQHKLLLANLVISFTLVVFYWLSVYVLGSILYDSIKVFEGLTKEIRPLKILYRIALSVFSFTASMYLSMIFILTSHQCLFYVSCVLLFILLLYICYFSLSSKNRRFLFIETRTAKLKKNVSLTRRLIGLMQSEEQLV